MRRIRYVAAILFVLGNTVVALAESPPREVIQTPAPALRARVPHSRLSPEARAAEIARLRYQLYRRVEYPTRLNQLDSEIQIAAAELQALDRQIDEYESISRPYMSHPFLVTLESARMRRLAIEQHLTNLQNEKLRTIQNFRTIRRLRKLEIEAGAP